MPHILYRLPNEEIIHELSFTHSPHALPSFTHIGERAGYIFAPFAPSAEHPILLFPFEQEKTWEQPSISPSTSLPFFEIASESRTAYHTEFQRCLTALTEKEVEKIVLSRQQILRFSQPISEQQQRLLFLKACCRYPESYIALIDADGQGSWLIATPELLLKIKATQLHTMALAGTMPLTIAATLSVADWSKKNRREQQFVTTYLIQCLSDLGLTPTVSPTYIQSAARLAHLCTDIEASISSTLSLGTIVAALHPTPAVCGLPAPQAAKLLHEIESQSRSYYSGFSGIVFPDNDTHLFVTLRCLQIHDQQARLFAGGGLLLESQEEAEWEETQRKMNTMLELLQ